MKDLVQGVAAGKVDGEIVVDLNKDEDNKGESDMPVVVSLGQEKSCYSKWTAC
jgi:exosome complex component RRP41